MSEQSDSETEHWKDADDCQSCGDSETHLRAIKMENGSRELLCFDCFIEARDDGRVHPLDPRIDQAVSEVREQ